MIRCDSCLKYFGKVGDLFEHIQSSCLGFYKSHPDAWAKILSRMSATAENTKQAPVAPVRTSQRQAKARAELTAALDQASTSTATTQYAPFVCKCESQFKTLESFKAHIKVCTPGKEPPFCIMFKAQQADNGKPLKNIHMTVNDYFYGTIPGRSVTQKRIVRRCNCYSCGKTLRNNIRFMSHVRHKIINEWEKKEKVDARNICQHCYRQYSSPFLLQCHLENVHGAVPASSTCRICELPFASEKTFLFHMKDKHVHNEAPYTCKVCFYQSSFYNDVIKHFRDEHTDTNALMCPFCLLVAFNTNSFLKHVLQHIKKGFECERCRLIFNTAKEKTSHQKNDHGTKVMKGKAQKYKNLRKCQIYVRVASFQMAQRQKLMQKDPEKFVTTTTPKVKRSAQDSSSSDPTLDGPSPTKRFFTAPSVELPAYLCPLKRPQKIKKIRLRNSKSTTLPMRCAECGETLEETPGHLLKHFESVHECRWCVYITSCEKAAQSHVLKEHADSELREELIGKRENENTNFSVELDHDDDDADSVIHVEDDLVEDLLPLPGIDFGKKGPEEIPAETPKETKSSTDDVKVTPPVDSPPTSSNTQSKARRKQSNPTKFAGQYEAGSPSPKKPRKEKQVQTNNFEKQTGTQVSDRDFKGTKNGGEKADSKKKKSKANPNSNKHRKVLAPEGYFPDIDDDAGWAKYFAEIQDNEQKKARGATGIISKSALPTMVPKTTAIAVMAATKVPTPENGQSNAAVSAGKVVGLSNSIVVTSQGIATSSQPSNPMPSKSSNTVQTIHPQWGAARPGLRTGGSVFRFQVVPPTTLTGVNTGLPVMQTPQNVGMMKSPNILRSMPPCPINLRCLEVTHSSMLIQWDSPPGTIISQYKVVFQGSGAPTVQLLPPEQTLVRLVGLKSETMYVVRVYSLYKKSSSQYALLYQKTNKLTRHSGAVLVPNDIVLLDDDYPNNGSKLAAKSVGVPLANTMIVSTTSTASLPSANSSAVSQNKEAGIALSAITQPLQITLPTFNIQTGVTASTTHTAAVLKTFPPPNTQIAPLNTKSVGKYPQLAPKPAPPSTAEYSEEKEKMMLINDLLAGFRKNKNLSVKVKPVKKASKIVDEKNTLPTVATAGSDKTDSDSGNGDDVVFMVVDSPELEDTDCTTPTDSAPEVSSTTPIVSNVTGAPISFTSEAINKSENERNSSEEQRESIQTDATLKQNNLEDDVGVNIVNVVSLSNETAENSSKQISATEEGDVIMIVDDDTTTTGKVDEVKDPSEQESSSDKLDGSIADKDQDKLGESSSAEDRKMEGDISVGCDMTVPDVFIEPQNTNGENNTNNGVLNSKEDSPKKSLLDQLIDRKTLEFHDSKLGRSCDDTMFVKDIADLGLVEPVLKLDTSLYESIVKSVDRGDNATPNDGQLNGVCESSSEQEPCTEPIAEESNSGDSKDQSNNLLKASDSLTLDPKVTIKLVVAHSTSKNEPAVQKDESENKSRTDAIDNKKDQLEATATKETTSSAENQSISQEDGNVKPVLVSLMPQPLLPAQKNIEDAAPKAASTVLATDDKTGTVASKNTLEPENSTNSAVDEELKVLDDSGSTDVCKDASENISKHENSTNSVLDEELKILDDSGSTDVCKDTPTLEDIKDIMDNDLSWL